VVYFLLFCVLELFCGPHYAKMRWWKGTPSPFSNPSAPLVPRFSRLRRSASVAPNVKSWLRPYVGLQCDADFLLVCGHIYVMPPPALSPVLATCVDAPLQGWLRFCEECCFDVVLPASVSFIS